MKPKQFRIFLATAFFCLVDLFLVATKNEEYRLISKPFIIPCILGIYLFSIDNIKTKWKDDMIVFGLISSWLGDILLQFDNLFIPGLIAFLLAHIFYIKFLVTTKSENTSFFKLRPVMLIAVLAYLIELMTLLWPHLGSLKIPVLTYGITISVMLSCALWQYQKLDARTSLLLIIGASFFVASDSLLAINKFKTQLEFGSIAIMTTYIIAQLFIVIGAIRYRTIG
jgi:uncharacterized membrane protein YhhN